MSLGVDEIDEILSAHKRMPTGASFQDGAVFGNWRVTAFIGKGGSGEVYRAVHVSLGTSAALKVLVRDGLRARERFVREARLLSELKSASFPRFFEYGEANGFFYLVMELLEPGDLPSGDREVARFLRQVCGAVAELHACGIVHRDIKPSNILWRTAGRDAPIAPTSVGSRVPRDRGRAGRASLPVPVLADLGLAKDITTSDAGHPKSDITQGGVGTPGYGAPEQMERGEASVASDIHALGVLADRCFGGRPPRTWRRIIERATSSIPERRYPSVHAFARAIQHRNFLRTAGFCASAALLLAAIAAGVAAWLAMGGGEWVKWRMLCERGEIVSVEEKSEPYESPVYGKCRRIFHVTNVVEGTIINLQARTLSFKDPIDLAPGEYRIIGPGRLDAALSGPSNAVVRLKNCVLNNMTTVQHPKNRISYVMEGGAYLNFVNLDESSQMRKSVSLAEACQGGNDCAVEFRGPLAFKELNRKREEERGRFAVLDLHGDELSVALDHPVHFRACGIAPEPKTGGGNCVATDMAEKFKSHELFELPSFFHFGRVDAFPCRDAAEFSGAGASQKELCCMAVDEISHPAEICNRQFQISPNFESSGCKFQQGNTTLTLDSSVECLTQRRREAESAANWGVGAH